MMSAPRTFRIGSASLAMSVFGALACGNVGADRHLQAFDTETGEKLFDYVAPFTVASTPTIAEGRVAFGSGMSWSVGSPGTLLIVLALP